MNFVLQITVIVLIFCDAFCLQEWQPSSCAEVCRCKVKEWSTPFPPFRTTHMRHVDCSGKELRDLPALPNDTQVLMLDDNLFWNFSSVIESLSVFENIQEISLSNNNISVVANNVNLTSLRRIVLNNNKICHLSTSIFKSFPSLNEISIKGNKLRSISRSTSAYNNSLQSLRLDFNAVSDLRWMDDLTNLGQLKILTLGGNHLLDGVLTKNVFSVFPELTSIIMEDMNINEIGIDVFSHLNELQSLDLDNNKLEAVPTEALMKIPKLQHFKMKKNYISRVGYHTFANMTSLETLDLSNQPFLQIVDHDSFYFLPKLQSVLLANNPRLTYIAGDSFKNCPMVETLDLQSTMIEIIEPKITDSLPALRKIYLKNNPINCNCMMMWVKAWIPEPDQNSDLGIDNMVLCNSPPQFRGSYLNDVNVEEKSCAPTVEPTFPLHMEVKQGDTMMLHCRALGFPSPQIYWLLPSGKAIHNKSDALKQGYSLNKYGTLSTSKIEDGNFTCIASNIKGMASREVWVKHVATSSTKIPNDPTTAVFSTQSSPFEIQVTNQIYKSPTSNAKVLNNFTTHSSLIQTILNTTHKEIFFTTSPMQPNDKITVQPLLPSSTTKSTGKQKIESTKVNLPVPTIEILNVLTTSALITWTSHADPTDAKTLDNLEMKIILEHNNKVIYNDYVQTFGMMPDWGLQTPEYNISLLEPDQTYKICLIIKCCGKGTENHSCTNLHTKKVIFHQKQNQYVIISVMISILVLICAGCFFAIYGKLCSFTMCNMMPGSKSQYQYLGLNKQSNQKYNIPMSELYPPLMEGLLNEKESAKPTDCLIDTQSSLVYT